MKVPFKSAVLRSGPVLGTVLFALVYSALKFVTDWYFRWSIPPAPKLPIWSMLVSIGIGSVTASAVVFVLLTLMHRQQSALKKLNQELNHELRNALQVLSYSVHQCDEETRPKAQEAIGSLTDAVRRISQRLDVASEHETRVRK